MGVDEMGVDKMGVDKMGMSQKFWSGGKIGPKNQNFWNIGPGRPFFPENFGPPMKISVQPT